MRTCVRLIVSAIVASAARGDISTSFASIPNPNAGQATFELRVTVSGGDDWTSSSMKGTVVGATFYQDSFGSFGGLTQPNPLLFPFFPSLEFDSFVTGPEGWPNVPGQGVQPGIASGGFPTSTMVDITWFDTPPNAGDGTFAIARLTFENLSPGWYFLPSGAHTTKNGGSTLYPYSIVLPEPGTLVLLVLGALVRRR